MYIITRQNRGRKPTRHGIVLDSLAPRHRETLLENYHIKDDCNDDRFLQIIFKMKDDEVNNIKNKKLYINPKTLDVNDFVTLKRNFQLIDWKCAECNKKIKSNIRKFTPENFVCSNCAKHIRNKKYLPDTIIESSYKFMMYCKDLIKKDQKRFIQYIKRNEK